MIFSLSWKKQGAGFVGLPGLRLRICDDTLSSILHLYVDAGVALGLRLVCKRFNNLVKSEYVVTLMEKFWDHTVFDGVMCPPGLLSYPGCLNINDFHRGGGGRLFPLCSGAYESTIWWMKTPHFQEDRYCYPVWWGCLFQHLKMGPYNRKNVIRVLQKARQYIHAWDPKDTYFKRAMKVANNRSLVAFITNEVNYTVLSPAFLQLFSDDPYLFQVVASSSVLRASPKERLGMWDTLAAQAPEFLTWVMNAAALAHFRRVQFVTLVYDTLSSNPLGVNNPWGVVGANTIHLWQGITGIQYLRLESFREVHQVWVQSGGTKLVPEHCAPFVHAASGFFYAGHNMTVWSSCAEYGRVVGMPHLQWARDMGLVDLGMGPTLVGLEADAVLRCRTCTITSLGLLHASYNGRAPSADYISQVLAHLVVEFFAWFQTPAACRVLHLYFYQQCLTSVAAEPQSTTLPLTLDVPLRDFFQNRLTRLSIEEKGSCGGGGGASCSQAAAPRGPGQ